MDNELITKAKAYVEAEQHPFFKKQVAELLEKKNEAQLQDRFYTTLAFGTGGLRGTIGGGTNRINPYIVQRATQGLSEYILENGKTDTPKCVIAFDSRNYSDEFAKTAACVLAANGIKTYLFSALRPTPQLSFAVRELEATAGIVITASHNPKEYNGYKVYWSDGAQIVPPHDSGIIAKVNQQQMQIKTMGFDQAQQQKKIILIDKEIDTKYRDIICSKALRPELISQKGNELKIVYTALHGSGAFPVCAVFDKLGFSYEVVSEQNDPDGNFPTVNYPNPEESDALKMAIEQAKKTDAHLVMGTDPDADRIGIAVKSDEGYTLLTGNQTGVLMADYLFSTLYEQGRLPDKPALVKTIVTSELQTKIAQKYSAATFDTLTGFKYIGEKIRLWQQSDNGFSYVFGGEESYGYLSHTEVRDKDAVSSAAVIAEMTLYAQSQGKTLLHRLEEIWYDFGYYEELAISKVFSGMNGKKLMDGLIDRLRSNPPEQIATMQLTLVKDYKTGVTKNILQKNEKQDINLPSSNVLQFIFHDETIITVRPSGTEPKIKFYASSHSEPAIQLSMAKQKVAEKLKAIGAYVDSLIDSMQ